MNRGEVEVNNNAKKGGGRYPGTLLGQKHLLYDEKNFFLRDQRGEMSSEQDEPTLPSCGDQARL